MAGTWNHNIHYHAVLLARLPQPCRHALDVGCGDGMFVRDLAARAARVTGIDTQAESIGRARELNANLTNVALVHDDFLFHPFDAGAFDFVSAVASLHHMELEPALERMKELLRPGGTLGVIGLARTRTPRDLGYDVTGALLTRAHRVRRGYWEHSAPVAAPTTSYGQVRRAATGILPGCQYRRHALWRYSLLWTKPE